MKVEKKSQLTPKKHFTKHGTFPGFQKKLLRINKLLHPDIRHEKLTPNILDALSLRIFPLRLEKDNDT